MACTVIDITRFLDREVFRQEDFLDRLAAHDFSQYQASHVLLSGCNSTIIPPWAFMALTARLVPVANSIRFGNDHDNIVIFRKTSHDTAK
jgi:hypothetical protein